MAKKRGSPQSVKFTKIEPTPRKRQIVTFECQFPDNIYRLIDWGNSSIPMPTVNWPTPINLPAGNGNTFTVTLNTTGGTTSTSTT